MLGSVCGEVEWEGVLKDLSGEQHFALAHPVSVDPEDPERVATPAEMCDVVKRVYQAGKHKDMRESTLALVDFMPRFHREVNREFLE